MPATECPQRAIAGMARSYKCKYDQTRLNA